MADPFNPYSDWLKIPHEEQPPDHYRLLGVQSFERDTEKIAVAADARMKMVRSFQSGEHAKQSQSLLNAVAAAKICLMDADRRSAYDVELRRRKQALNLPPLPVMEDLVPRNEMPMRAPDHIRKSIPRNPDAWLVPLESQKRVDVPLQKWMITSAIGILAVFGLVIALAWYQANR